MPSEKDGCVKGTVPVTGEMSCLESNFSRRLFFCCVNAVVRVERIVRLDMDKLLTEHR